MKLEDACRHYLTQHKAHPHTYRAYEQTTKRLCRFLGGARPLHLIKDIDLLEFAASLEDEDLAPATIYKHKKNTKIIFKWFTEEAHWIEENPCGLVRLRRVPNYVRKEKAMTDSELNKLLDYFKYQPMQRALVLFLSDTGCRIGGAATLTIDNLDLPERMAYVTEKGDKTRPVWFEQTCAGALSEWLIKRPKADHNFVFCHASGPYNPPSLAQIIRRACIALDMRSLGPHSLRHRKGRQLADARVAITIAARALGHNNFMTTLESYYPQDYERAQEAIRELATKQESETLQNIIQFKKQSTS